MSKQYFKDSPVLDFGIEEHARKTLGNLKQNEPSRWFTKALQDFIETQNVNTKFNNQDLEKWKFNCKILYLTIEELSDENLHLPPTMADSFLDECIELLNNRSPNCNLKQILSNRKVKDLVNKSIERKPMDRFSHQLVFRVAIIRTWRKT